MRFDDLLVLDYNDFSEKLAVFYRKLSDSQSTRELFIRNPTGVISDLLFPEAGVSHPEINQGNRLLYALLSNERFMAWSGEYQAGIEDRIQEIVKTVDSPAEAMRILATTIDRQKIYQEITEAITRDIDVEILAGLTWKLDPDRIPKFEWPKHKPFPLDSGSVVVEIEVAVYAVAVAAVFAVAVAAVVAGEPVPDGINRVDLQRISAQIAENIRQQAVQLREHGILRDIRSAGSRGVI